MSLNVARPYGFLHIEQRNGVLRPSQNLYAVQLADGWYVVDDPTFQEANGSLAAYLSFLQHTGDLTVMVNVPLSEIKGAAFYGMPERTED